MNTNSSTNGTDRIIDGMLTEEFYKKRNAKIVELKEGGASYSLLSKKFNVSVKRIKLIYFRDKLKSYC